jgi:hypothetical protein
MALVPWLALGLASLLSTTWIRFAPAPILAGLILVAILLHPTGRSFFRSFRASRVSRFMLALVIIASVPLIVLASANVSRQRILTNDHAALGHYGFMAAFGFTVIAVGLLATLRPDGWRLTAWTAGLLPALLGLTSLVYPDVDSSLAVPWALAAIAWGVVFVAVAERTRKFVDPDSESGWHGSRSPSEAQPASTRPV